MGWHLRTNCSECHRLFNYNGGGGLTCNECKALKEKEFEMNQVSTCPRCLRVTQGECEFCKRAGARMAKTLTNDDMNPPQTVDIVTEHCGNCMGRFNTTSDAKIYFCPYCNHKHQRVGPQLNKAPVFGANNKKIIDEAVEGITKEIEALKTKLARKEIELETLKLVRGMMK